MPGPDELERDLAKLPYTRSNSGADVLDDWRKQEVSARLFGVTQQERQRIGRFVILDVLGRGGMGSVFRAHDETLDREVAVKLMHVTRAGQHGKRMLREAQALARLSHPNVVQVYEVGEIEDQMFIAMELVEGQTLRQWQEDPQPWRRCLDVYLQAGRGLAAAHAAGMIHRDFKPANCILDPSGRVCVLDFGLARNTRIDDSSDEDEDEDEDEDDHDHDHAKERPQLERSGPVSVRPKLAESSSSMLEQKLTRTGSIMGTVAFMAPEQLRGGDVDAQADQFSFCVSLYEALFGQRPFSQNPISALTVMAKGESVEPLPAPQNIRVPRTLLRALRRGLSALPEQRWPTMNALLDVLARCQRRPRAGWVAAVGLAAVGLTATVGMLTSTDDRSPCHGADRGVTGLWGSEQQQRVQLALQATDLPYAASTWTAVDGELLRYANALGSAYVEACQATKIRFEQTGDDLKLRDKCLGRRASALRQTVLMLENADTAVAERAVELMLALPSFEECADVEGLRRSARVTGVDQAEHERVRDRLRRARNLMAVGKHAEGLDEVESLTERARALGGPLLAEVLVVGGQIRAKLGRSEQAVEQLEHACRESLRNHAAPTAFEALVSLIRVVGLEQAKPGKGLAFEVTASGLVGPEAEHPQSHAELLTAVGNVLIDSGRLVEAERNYRAALELLGELFDDHHISLAEPLDGLAVALRRQQHNDRALEYSHRALELRERWRGKDHPDIIAHQFTNLGAVHHAREEYREAEQRHRKALQILLAAESPDQWQIAHARTNLGAALGKLRRWDDAEQEFGAAIEELEAKYGPIHPRVATVRMSLGRLHQDRQRFDQAISQYERVLEIFDRSESTPRIDKREKYTRTWLEQSMRARNAALEGSREQPSRANPSSKPAEQTR